MKQKLDSLQNEMDDVKGLLREIAKRQDDTLRQKGW